MGVTLFFLLVKVSRCQSVTMKIITDNQKIHKSALTWLTRGAALVPLQPNSKRVVSGFGPYLKRITEPGAARFWFAERACNLAIIAGDAVTVADFDDVDAYRRWAAQYPQAARTYTERTRRGYHAYFLGASASGLRAGAEILGRGKLVTVAPSVVGGVAYAPVVQADLQSLPPRLSLLSKPKLTKLSREGALPGQADLVANVKASWDLLTYAQTLTRFPHNEGRWYHGDCPLSTHRATRKAGKLPFWVDTERGLWGCFACHTRGDVINLYAKANGLSVTEAIRAMVGVGL